MGLFDSLDVSASALTAERLRMDVTAGNLANAQTTQGANGQPYRRREVVLQEAQGGGQSFDSILASASASPVNGVQVAGVVEDPAEPRRVYDPGHPDADAEGYVAMPNVDTVSEMVDLITSQRAYEANVTAMQSAKAMFGKTLEILR